MLPMEFLPHSDYNCTPTTVFLSIRGELRSARDQDLDKITYATSLIIRARVIAGQFVGKGRSLSHP